MLTSTIPTLLHSPDLDEQTKPSTTDKHTISSCSMIFAPAVCRLSLSHALNPSLRVGERHAEDSLCPTRQDIETGICFLCSRNTTAR